MISSFRKDLRGKQFIFALFSCRPRHWRKTPANWPRCRQRREDSLRQEVLDNVLAVNEVLALMAEGKVRKPAGQPSQLGMSAMKPSIAASLSMPGPARTCRRPCTASAWTARKAVSEFCPRRQNRRPRQERRWPAAERDVGLRWLSLFRIARDEASRRPCRAGLRRAGAGHARRDGAG
ncbi:MAG: hypothetical protein IPF44_05820 [Betaproteobacteria bacterium]|nr:hypothetical protein [Betaproteobacteria bacterium]